MTGTLILASASMVRLALLRHAGVSVTPMPARIDETRIKQAMRSEGGTAGACALRLAEEKALEISRSQPASLVLGADQILVLDEEWFDKPSDRGTARRQLVALRGQVHHLVTAAAVARGGRVLWRCSDEASLTLRLFTDEFIDDYLETCGDDILSSVGAYQLEGVGAQLFEKIEGNFFTILGLPLLPVLACLRAEGMIPT